MIIIASPGPNTNILGGSNLYVINKVSVPQGFEDAVGKPAYKNILDGFFSQVMIDAIDLLFIQKTFQLLVKILC